MKTLLFVLLGVVAGAYVLLCVALWLGQERLLFHPEKLPANYRFQLPGRWQERFIKAPDGALLSGLLFEHQGDAPARGVVYFLHGNGGSLASWGQWAHLYTRWGYDVFLLDYRGYGKSGGQLYDQEQLLADVDAGYKALAATYSESSIVLAGYSLGTGPATWLASRHQPRRLLLHAPYASMSGMAARTLGWVWRLVPGWLLRYPLPANEWISSVSTSVWLIHGQRDTLIPPASSTELHFRNVGSNLLLLPDSGHNDILQSPIYQRMLPRLLLER